MVATRRRSLAVQVSPKPVGMASSEKQLLEEKKRTRKRTSHSSSPVVDDDEEEAPQKRRPPIRGETAENTSLRRRSSAVVKVPSQTEKSPSKKQASSTRGKRKSSASKNLDGEDVRSEAASSADSWLIETAEHTPLQNSSNKENEVQCENSERNSGENEIDNSSAPQKRKRTRKENDKPAPVEKGSVERRSSRKVPSTDHKAKEESKRVSKPTTSLKKKNIDPPSESDGEIPPPDEDSDDSDFSPSHRSKRSKRPTSQKGEEENGAQKKRRKPGRKQRSTTPQEEPRSSAETEDSKSQQKNSESIVPADILERPRVKLEIAAIPRDLSPGEQMVEKFRIYAAAVAVGRSLEITLEEASQSVQVLKTLCGSKNVAPVTEQHTQDLDNDESSSEDEWEEMELVDGGETKGKDVQVTVEDSDERNFESLWMRREVNRCIRENWENCHRVNVLCYIAHLQYLRNTVLGSSMVLSSMLSMVPPECGNPSGKVMTAEKALKLVKHFESDFKTSDPSMKFETDRRDMNAFISEMISKRIYEKDVDRAVLLFALFASMGCTARICVSIQPIPRKWDESVLKWIAKMRDGSSSSSVTSQTNKKGKGTSKKNSTSGSDRNYWIEYWDKKQKRWICVDPFRATVDEPSTLEENVTKPMVYVLAIDSEGGVRDVTPRYAADFSRPEFRRRRTNPDWIARTLRKKSIQSNRRRAKLEDADVQKDLVKKPLPTTLSEYKNHPLYVLEKDLLKFEAIYPRPEDQKPLGEIRGHKVYPRSTVHTLQGANNWIKMARSVKEGEKPYKVVKARPNIRVPPEEREQRYLDVYGYWQTEPYRPPKVKDGRIPCNEFGNVYMFQPSMCPIGAVHLRLSGLPSIARRLGGLECVPAVVGFDFSSGGSFPVIDGAVVLKQDADKFVKEWKRLEATKEERENKRREDRVLGNWRKLIRGILRLHYVKTKFGATKEKTKGKKKKETKDEAGEANQAVIDRTVKAQRQVFTHDDLMQLKR